MAAISMVFEQISFPVFRFSTLESGETQKCDSTNLHLRYTAIRYQLYNLKNVKNIHGGELLIVKL